VALAVAVASLAAYVAVENRLRGDIDSSLRDQAREIDGHLGRGFGDRFGGPGRRGEAPVYAQLVGSDGTTSQPPVGGVALQVDARTREVAAGSRAAFLSDQTAEGAHLRVLTTQVAPGVAAQLARGLDETDSLLDRLRVVLLLVTAGGVVTGAALGWFISGRALRPVRAFTERTERIAGDPDVAARLP
jgi:two-component system sensor histidine kinase MprB